MEGIEWEMAVLIGVMICWVGFGKGMIGISGKRSRGSVGIKVVEWISLCFLNCGGGNY